MAHPPPPALPPVIKLDELKRDILDKEPSAALPSHLSDQWLNQVAESLEQVLEVQTDESGPYLAGPLALVVHLLFFRSPLAELEISEICLYEYLRTYYMEVSIEMLNRHTKIRVNAATLQTIFTDRKLTSC